MEGCGEVAPVDRTADGSGAGVIAGPSVTWWAADPDGWEVSASEPVG